MKTLTIQNAELPGVFAIHAESAAEILLLRAFANWPSLVKERCTLGILSHGGNSSEGAYSVTIGWRKDAMDSPAPAPTSEVDDQEKQYPVTGMDDDMLAIQWAKLTGDKLCALRGFANAALRHAIDAGQVAPKEAYDQCSRDLGKAERLLESLGYRSANGEWNSPTVGSYQLAGTLEAINHVRRAQDRAARDMAVAEAVRDAAVRGAAHAHLCFRGLQAADLDLAAIIAKVQP